MKDAVTLFESSDALAFAAFAQTMATNGAGGERWRELHKIVAERFIPARQRYLAALDEAKAARADVERRQADALRAREEVTRHLSELEAAISSQYPAELTAADAAPAQIKVKANESLESAEIEQIGAAMSVYAQAFKA